LKNNHCGSTIIPEESGGVIVITGATGHIGNVLVRELTAQGQMVGVLVVPNDDCRPLSSLEVDIVRGDVTDLKGLESSFSGADIIFHLAGIITICPV
jgi:dihydroflavonol-4-reductase